MHDFMDDETTPGTSTDALRDALEVVGGRLRGDRRETPTTLRGRAQAAVQAVESMADPDADLTHRTTRFHRWLWRDGQYSEQGFVTDGQDRPGWERCAREVYADLLEGAGKLKHLDDVSPAARWAQEVHQDLDDSPDYHTLRALCRDDPEWSGLGAGSVMRAVLDAAPEPTAKHDPETAKAAAEAARDMGDEELAGELEAIAAEQQQAADADADAIADAASNIRAAVNEAASQATATVEQAQDMQQALGGSAAGSSDAKPGTEEAREQSLALAKAVSELPDMAEVIRIAGRLQSSARAYRREKVRRHVGPVVDVTRGGIEDVPRLLGSELVKLDGAELEMTFDAALVERTALVYEMEGEDDANERGPIVLMMDISGSMGNGDPSRLTWSKGVLVAVAGACRREGRGLVICHYNTTVQRFHAWPSPPSITELLDELSVGTSGGTRLSNALPDVLARLVMERGSWDKADFVIVTDGADSLDPAVVTEAQNTGRSLFAVFIECGIECGAPEWAKHLDGYCELDDAAIAAARDTEAADLVLNQGLTGR